MIASEDPCWSFYREEMARQGVPEKHRPFYQGWVLKWQGASLDPSPRTEAAQVFASWLEARGVPEWQCRQAYQAVRLWEASQKTPEPPRAGAWPEVLAELRVRLESHHYSPRTIEVYGEWTRRFARFCPRVPQDAREVSGLVQGFLRSLVHERNLSRASLAQARNALACLARKVMGLELVLEDKGDAHHARKIPQVLAASVVARILGACQPPWDLFFQLQYGCGLGLAELLDLRVGEVGLERGVLVVRGGKGDKDRQLPLPGSVRPLLQAHLAKRRDLWKSDLSKGLARVVYLHVRTPDASRRSPLDFLPELAEPLLA